MKATFIIVNKEAREGALKAISALHPSEPHEVIIRPKKANRSLAANALMWQWLTILAGDTGHTKEELHEQMKRKHLIPIFRRDDPDYAEMIQCIQGLRGHAKYEATAKQIERLTSTTRCSVAQFTEYLNAVEATALDMGCVLPHPEDVYYEAMGNL